MGIREGRCKASGDGRGPEVMFTGRSNEQHSCLLLLLLFVVVSFSVPRPTLGQID